MRDTKLLASPIEFRRVERVFKFNCVDPNWIDAQRSGMPITPNVRELSFDPQKALRGVTEMTQVTEGMKTDQVGAEQLLDA